LLNLLDLSWEIGNAGGRLESSMEMAENRRARCVQPSEAPGARCFI
jgi:hypothetical protein